MPVALAATFALTGCATTMQTAARLQLNSARIRASEVPTRVTVAGATVAVTRLAVIAARGGTAFVVQVHNASGRAVSDLPISVGVRAGHRRIYLNTQSPLEFSYFDAHLPAMAARGSITWVYTTHRRLPADARPFAVVGTEPSPPASVTSPLPVIRATPLSAAASQLPVVLRNLTSIPQYQLQVYAFAQRGDRFVAAGALTVPELGSQARQTLRVGLLGSTAHARLQLEALPTIFQ